MAAAGGCCCRCGAGPGRATPAACAGVCALVLVYTLLGAVLFLALEGAPPPPGTAAASHIPPEPNQPDLRARTVDRLWAITEDLNILYKENWTKLAAKELLDFQKVLMQSLRNSPEADHDYRWTFSGSFLYALTLITTIGHGNVTPKSATGKLVAIAYACIGIPIIMLYLATLGDALARRVRALYWRMRPSRGPHPARKPPLDERRTPFQNALNLDTLPSAPRPCRAHARVPAPLGLLLIALYVGLGSAVFHATERWTLLDGCYFSFSSLATIGFGDLRPGLYAGTVSAKAEDIAVGVCCIYILVGIVVIAMCFNLIQEDLSAVLRSATGLCSRPAVHATARNKPPVAAS